MPSDMSSKVVSNLVIYRIDAIKLDSETGKCITLSEGE